MWIKKYILLDSAAGEERLGYTHFEEKIPTILDHLSHLCTSNSLNRLLFLLTIARALDRYRFEGNANSSITWIVLFSELSREYYMPKSTVQCRPINTCIAHSTFNKMLLTLGKLAQQLTGVLCIQLSPVPRKSWRTFTAPVVSVKQPASANTLYMFILMGTFFCLFFSVWTQKELYAKCHRQCKIIGEHHPLC